VDSVILVVGPEEVDYARQEIVDRYGFSKVKMIVVGGRERYESVYLALKEGKTLGEGSYVLVHDGARAFITPELISKCIENVKKDKAVVLGMPVKDTIKVVSEDGWAAATPDRKTLWQVQTPQVFRYSLVKEAYRRLLEKQIGSVTDDAMVVEKMTDSRVRLVEGSYRNLKVTTPEDLECAEIFLKKNQISG
jgi:2-C-methyl-D-erythritol 4-phosphate cytidylyltransferase